MTAGIGHSFSVQGVRSLRGLPVNPDPMLSRVAIGLVLSLLLTLPAFLIDDRVFQGENVWIKPIKFQIALALYFVTLAYFAAWLPRPLMLGQRMRGYLVLVGFATLLELLWIGGAAMFASASHYNSQPLFYTVYLFMGVLAVVLTSVSLVFGVAFFKDRQSVLPEPLRLSLALGLVLTFCLTLLAAGTLSVLPGHFIGTPITEDRLPVFGWSREVGDLRVAHFFATHALHAVPLVGVLALFVRDSAFALRFVWAGAVVFAAFVLFTYVQALAGRPFP